MHGNIGEKLNNLPENLEEVMKKKYVHLNFLGVADNGKINVSCVKCGHVWPTSVRNAVVFILRVMTVTGEKVIAWMK